MSVYLPSADGYLIFEVSESPTFAATQVWHDLTSYIHRDAGITIDRGRASEFDEVRAGTLNLTLNISDGLLDPRNDSSPHAGCLKMRRRCRLRLVDLGDIDGDALTWDGDALTWDGDALTWGVDGHPLFYGFTNSFPRVFNRPNVQGLMPLNASDGFRVMGNTDPSAELLTIEHPVKGRIGFGRIGGVGYGEMLSGTLVAEMLDAMAWPTDLRDIDAGVVVVDAGASEDKQRLATIREAAKAEGGDVYISRDGKLTFRDRHARYTESRSVTSQATFSPTRIDRPSYTEPLEVLLDDTRFVNDARYTGTSKLPQFQPDTASIAEYGVNDDIQSLISVNDDDAMSLVVLALDENATPVDRVEQLVVNVHSQTAYAVPSVLDRELFDQVSVVVGSTYGAANETIPAIIQGIRHSISTTSWFSTFRLGPYHPRNLFTIANSTLGAIQSVGVIAP